MKYQRLFQKGLGLWLSCFLLRRKQYAVLAKKNFHYKGANIQKLTGISSIVIHSNKRIWFGPDKVINPINEKVKAQRNHKRTFQQNCLKMDQREFYYNLIKSTISYTMQQSSHTYSLQHIEAGWTSSTDFNSSCLNKSFCKYMHLYLSSIITVCVHRSMVNTTSEKMKLMCNSTIAEE